MCSDKLVGEDMLKEIMICIIIVISILFGNYKTQNYTKESVSNLSEKLMYLRQELIKEENEINEQNLKEKIEAVWEEWNKKHDKLAYFIEHDELEKVETSLTSIKSYIETKEYQESVNEVDKGEFILKHIEEKYEFNLKNIF